MRILAKVRKAINKALYPLTAIYHAEIPLDEIFGILKSHGLIVVQEDGTPWEGILCGNDASGVFDLTGDGQPVENGQLVMQWYRMSSGRWEVNCYVS